jgi:D-glycero-D-manno-heptose 1,7-bisphosphate phosphatase
VTGQRGPITVGTDAPPAAGRPRPAAFLDRDGVINEGAPDPETGLLESPLWAADVRLLAGAAEALRSLSSAGYALVCVTNQPAAAKGRATIEELLAVHERVVELLAGEGIRLDGTRICPHHPQGTVAALTGPCPCRKPAAGMLLDAARSLGIDRERSWMLGDTDADVAAGRAAGARTVLVEYPGSAHKRAGAAGEDMQARDLRGAAALLRGAQGG